MRETVIQVENLSKRYRLGLKEQKAETLIGRLTQAIKSPIDNFRRLTSMTKFDREDESVFYALNDINFNVEEGDVLGIIGKNGAGKSTLLKILSRITEPSSGQVQVTGRVSSLLEVGTGFHPEMTGRENVYLNGTILGMTKKEIDRKLDEIISFSGIEKFIDTSVKFYSSGMKVRLGFSVAAHLEPEVLIIDEVLAVGDVEFQTKCLGKMEDVSKRDGRTVLFVSHNMAAVQNLCSRAILLKNGRVFQEGSVNDIVKTYLSENQSDIGFEELSLRQDRKGNALIRFEKIWFEDGSGSKVSTLCSGMCGVIAIQINNLSDTVQEDVIVAIGIDDSYGRRIAVLNNELTNQKIRFNASERLVVRIEVDPWPLAADGYSYTLFSSVKGGVSDWITNAGKFTVENGDFFHTGRMPPRGQGNFLVPHRFLQDSLT